MCSRGAGTHFRGFLLSLLFIGIPGAAFAQTPPDPPVIIEPPVDSLVLNAADVHLETNPMSDSDSGDTHFCSDWEIWTVNPVERVWASLCITGTETVHNHLGDGIFEGSHAGRTELFYDETFRLRVRHQDNTALWGGWSERIFLTGPEAQIFPLEFEDVASTPTPVWQHNQGSSVILPGFPNPGFLDLDHPVGGLLLRVEGFDGSSNMITNPASLGVHWPVRVVISGGGAGMALTKSGLALTDDDGADQIIYLPPLNLAANDTAYMWVGIDGSTYWGNGGQTEPDFSDLARGAAVPWIVLQPGYEIEIVATGFQLPVNIAFVPSPGLDPGDPLYYVTELYGSIKVVTNDGTVSDYATNLLNFNPTGAFPGSGEQGVAGIVVEPATGDVYASMVYDGGSNQHYAKVDRFTSNDGGLTAATQTTILDMAGELVGASHQISNLSIGPDNMLYINNADGGNFSTALDTTQWRGKILRSTIGGAAPADNPFYGTGNGITATDFIYAYGFRNPFGGRWRESDGFFYEIENGPSQNDRLAKVIPGASYGWDGTGASMLTGASYVWTTPHGVVNMAFIQNSEFNGSEFPASKIDHCYVTESDGTWSTGPQTLGKRVVEFELAGDGSVVAGPTTLVEYTGSGKATAVGLASGPDGLYFTDLYKDQDYLTPIDPGANVLRIKYVGIADFVADATSGEAPLPVQFTDLSDISSPSAWNWEFGDGNISTAQNPMHTYTTDGTYNVRLTVTGSKGVITSQKNGYVIVGDIGSGLTAAYYDEMDFTDLKLTRIDSEVNFQWLLEPPDPSMAVDSFSVQWTGQVKAGFTETYTFYTQTDDGVRLWVNSELLIDEWQPQGSTEFSATIDLVADRKYDIRMDFFDQWADALAELYWSSPSVAKQIIPQARLFPAQSITAGGLQGAYFDEINLAGIKLNRIDPVVDFDWTSGSPDPLIAADSFSIRWTGQVLADHSEIYTFYTTTDDGVRLWVDGQVIIDQWVNQSATEHSGTIMLAAGQRHDISLEYFENGGDASVRLEWSSPTVAREVIPASHLFSLAVSTGITEAPAEGESRFAFELLGPTPFRLGLGSSFRYVVPNPGAHVRIDLYNITGRRVARVVDRFATAGIHTDVFSGKAAGPIASGVYFLRMDAGEFSRTRRIILLK